MGPTEEIADDAWLDGVLTRARAPEVPDTLRLRILADFDRVAARWTIAKALRGLSDLIWPGAPAWQPAMAFALSLMIGLGVAAFAPIGNASNDDGSSNLLAFEAPQDLDAPQGI